MEVDLEVDRLTIADSSAFEGGGGIAVFGASLLGAYVDDGGLLDVAEAQRCPVHLGFERVANRTVAGNGRWL